MALVPAGYEYVLVIPSPQSTTRVKLSSVPGSLIVALSVALSPSSIDGLSVSASSDGATLLTVTVVLAVALAPPSSVSVRAMV